MEAFQVNDIVFARLRGNRPWPAFIVGKDKGSFSVVFFGDGLTAKVHSKSLFKQSDEQVDSIEAEVRNKQKVSVSYQAFLTAIKEMKIEGKQI